MSYWEGFLGGMNKTKDLNLTTQYILLLINNNKVNLLKFTSLDPDFQITKNSTAIEMMLNQHIMKKVILDGNVYYQYIKPIETPLYLKSIEK